MTASPYPVFLVGCVRSGTTLLGLLLDRHPDIHWLGEFEYPVRYCRDVGWPEVRAYCHELEVDRSFTRDDMRIDPALDYVGLARSFFEQRRERAPEHRVLGCTVHSRMDRLPEIWPNARYIHLVRDPRDVARSVVSAGWAGHPMFGVEMWLTAERRWERLRTVVPEERCHELHYEELVKTPGRTLAQLCDFLELDMDDLMLAPNGDATYGPPDAALAEQWKRKASPRDVQRIESRTGPLLEARGYELSVSPPRSVAPLERGWLYTRHRWGIIRHSVQEYGLGLWMQRFLANLIGLDGWQRSVQVRINEARRRTLR